MKYIFSLNLPFDTVEFIKGFLFNMGFTVRDGCEVNKTTSNLKCIVEADNAQRGAVLEMVLKRYNVESMLVVVPTGASYTQYLSTGVKIYNSGVKRVPEWRAKQDKQFIFDELNHNYYQVG